MDQQSSLQSRPVSLSGQLIVTFVILLAATVAGLTFVADTTSLDNLEAQAMTAARTTAQTREQLLKQLLSLRLRRANGFLSGAESLCAEPYGRRWLAWADSCITTMLNEFQKTEQARGALMTYRGRRLLNAGQPVAAPVEPPEPDALATVSVRGDKVSYFTLAERNNAALVLEFDDDDIVSLIKDNTGVGDKGEVFLLDKNGRPLTPLSHDAPAGSLKTIADLCRATEYEEEQKDYRGVRVIPAYTLLRALPDVCLVTFIDYAEALEPAAELRRSLIIRGIAFILTGVLLSLIAARHIAAPVRRLAATARALQGGDFSQRVPVAGPSEVQGLGRAVAAMASDLAELLSQEQSGRRAAEAANRSKDQFLAMLSHELRTPLTAVLGWAHTLRVGAHDADQVHRAAAAIERSAESQRRLIEDLLDVTGIAAGRVRMNLEPTRVVEPVEAALDAVRPRAQDKDVRVESVIDDATMVVHADPQRLQQVVWNLVWNAVKFTPAGGTVSVRVRSAEGLAELTVTDTGVGIDPEFLPHVFGWFRREDRATRAVDEGLGLGLALVRQLVELHSGTVHASSGGRNRGSTFVVTLPLHRADASRLPDPEVHAAAAPPPDLKEIRVLVVDDDPGSREAVRVLLEQVGAQVTTAGSAAEARRHLHSAETDVLISDIAMAEESGYAFMETIRAEGLTLPSIALTGYARREDADRAYAAGFDVHLPKPVDPDVLVSVLDAIARRHSH